MSNAKIGYKEAITLLLTIAVANSLSFLPRNIILTAKTATLINIVYVTIIALLIGYLIYRLLITFPNSDIIDISETVGGKVFKNIVGIIFILYFIITSSIFLRDFCESLKLIYYPITNTVYILLLFIIGVCLVNKLNFNASIKVNLLILPLAFISIAFLFFANLKYYSFERVFPILGNGLNSIFFKGLINLSAFEGIIYLYFLPPYLKEPTELKKITLVSIILSSIYLLFCVCSILFMFSPFLNTNEIMPLYTATRYIEFGHFFQRLDTIFLLIWILAFCCYLNYALKFSANIFKKITKIQTVKPLVYIFGLLIFSIAMMPRNVAIIKNFESNIYPNVVLGIVFVFGISILIIANLKNRRKKDRGVKV